MKKILLTLFLFTICLSAQKQPYTILISFDGFRWDYLNRNLSPNLQKIMDNGVHALSLRPAFPSKTFPNHYSIISGMYPAHHGIIANLFHDPIFNQTYTLSNAKAVKESRYYIGEAFWETAKRQGIITASYFWPGSEVKIDYRRPNYVMEYDHNRDYYERVDGVINWLKMPYKERPKFITLYFDATDTQGHKYGPNSSECNKAIIRLDSIMNYLNKKLVESGLKDSTNIIIVSDHGMTEVSDKRIINVEEILKDFSLEINGVGTLKTINPSKDKIDDVYNTLYKNRNHYKVYKKENLPDYYEYKDHYLIEPIIIIADMGWSLITNKEIEKVEKGYMKGNHGYEKDNIDMHGIFIAEGPSFRKGFRTGTLWNIDIYPLLCKIYNVTPRSNIDGKLERIEFILADK